MAVKRIAEPIGVIVAAVIPTTNPTSTAIFKTLLALKTRNAIIICPASRVPRSAPSPPPRIVLEAAVAAGAPEGIIGWIDVPSLEITNVLMKDADIILATGGPGMVQGGLLLRQARPGRRPRQHPGHHRRHRRSACWPSTPSSTPRPSTTA